MLISHALNLQLRVQAGPHKAQPFCLCSVGAWPGVASARLDAGGQTVLDGTVGDVSPLAEDEDEQIRPRLLTPRLAPAAVGLLADALHDEPAVLAGQREEALDAEEVVRASEEEPAEPRVEAVPIDQAGHAHAHGLEGGRRIVIVSVIMSVVVPAVLVIVPAAAGHLRRAIALARQPVRFAGGEEVFDADPTALSPVDLGERILPADELLEATERGGLGQIHLVHQHDARGRHLRVEEDTVGRALSLVAFGIHNRHHAVQRVVFRNGARHKHLHERPGICQAGGLDDDVVEAFSDLEEIAQQGVRQSALQRAADAAVSQLDHRVAVGLLDQSAIDADGTELIDDDGDPHAVVAFEDAVDGGGLTGSEEAGDDGDRLPLLCSHVFALRLKQGVDASCASG